MRVAQQVCPDARLAERTIEHVQVELVAAAGCRERCLDDPPVRELEPEEERRVDRRVNDDAAARPGDRLDELGYAGHHVRYREDQVRLRGPAAKAVRGELRERLPELALVRIAEVAGRQCSADRVLDLLGRIEVHLGHERGQHVRRVGAPLVARALAQAVKRAVTQNRVHSVDRSVTTSRRTSWPHITTIWYYPIS